MNIYAPDCSPQARQRSLTVVNHWWIGATPTICALLLVAGCRIISCQYQPLQRSPSLIFENKLNRDRRLRSVVVVGLTARKLLVCVRTSCQAQNAMVLTSMLSCTCFALSEIMTTMLIILFMPRRSTYEVALSSLMGFVVVRRTSNKEDAVR